MHVYYGFERKIQTRIKAIDVKLSLLYYKVQSPKFKLVLSPYNFIIYIYIYQLLVMLSRNSKSIMEIVFNIFFHSSLIYVTIKNITK